MAPPKLPFPSSARHRRRQNARVPTLGAAADPLGSVLLPPRAAYGVFTTWPLSRTLVAGLASSRIVVVPPVRQAEALTRFEKSEETAARLTRSC